MSIHKDTEYDVRDVILIDKSMVKKKLSLWAAFVVKEAKEIADLIDSHPIVIATHVKAGKFGGGNWSSTFFSNIKANDEVPEVEELRQWANENTKEITRIREGLQTETGESSAQRRSSQIGNTKTIISIASLNEQDEQLSFVRDFVASISARLFIIKLLAIQFGDSKKQLKFSVQHVEEVAE
ncbi:replication protein A 70 kDa DNA-binding subunit D-like [Silene latifolia]|uniref:replication protein A 70 kDa DNA-binding subunit D-like n=1 Tax=Silene latifolia TaxID=37657 RepID=UPI003D76D56B